MSTNAYMNGKRPGEEQHSSHGRPAWPSKRQKMTKGSHKKDEADVEPEDGILPLRLTTHSGFLPLKDAGRFLLMVSKGMTASIYEEGVSLDAEALGGALGGNGGDGTANDGEERLLRLRQSKVRNEVWKTLCEIKWRKPKVLKHLASTLGGDGDEVDWERLCRKFLPQPAQQEVRASVDDYSFILSLFDCAEEEKDTATPLSTYVLEGEKAANFLKTGQTSFLKLDEPVKIGVFDNANEPMEGILSTLHAIRKSDGKSCELNTLGLFHIFEEQEDRDIYGSGWTTMVGLGKLHMLVNTDQLEITMDQNFAVAKDDRNGGVDFCITHVKFSANIICNDNQLFKEDMEEGATYADFLELLDEWK